MIVSNDKDHSTERIIMRSVYDNYPSLNMIPIEKWKHNTDDKVSNYDFEAEKLDHKVYVDCKERAESSTTYKTHFISTEKVDFMNEHPNDLCYIAYHFLADNKIFLYLLNNTKLQEGKVSFYHERQKKQLEQNIYEIPHRPFDLELYVF